MWVWRWIIDEKYPHILDLLLSAYKNNGFFDQEEDVYNNGSSNKLYDSPSNRPNDGPSNGRDSRIQILRHAIQVHKLFEINSLMTPNKMETLTIE